MKVRYKPTGQLGEIPDDKFDASLFDSVEESVVRPQSSPQPQTQVQPAQQKQGGLLGLLGSILEQPIKGAKIVGEGIASGADLLANTPNLLQGKPLPQYQPKFLSPQDYNSIVRPDLNTGDSLKAATEQGLKGGLGLASLTPVGKAGSLSSLFKTGALSGGLAGASQVESTDEAGQALTKIGSGAALGAGGAGLFGKLFGGAGRNSVASQTDNLASPNMLTKSGNALRQGVVNPKVSATPFAAAEEEAITSGLASLGLKGSAQAQRQQAVKAFGTLSDDISNKLGAVDQPIKVSNVVDDLSRELDNSINFDPAITGYQTAKNKFFNQLTNIANKGDDGLNVTPSQLFQFKQNLGKQLTRAYDKVEKGTPLSPQEEVGIALYDSIKRTLNSAVPGISDLTERQALLFKASRGLQESARSKVSVPIIGNIPGATRPTQAAADLAGRGLQAAGGAVSGAQSALSAQTGNPLLDRVLGAGRSPTAGAQVGANLGSLLGAPGQALAQTPEMGGIQESVAELQSTFAEGSEQPDRQITPEQMQAVYGAVAQGQLSKKTADAIKDAFDVQEKALESGKGSAEEKKKERQKEVADRIVSQLEDLYFGGGQSGLASGRLGGLLSKGSQAAGLNPNLTTYTNARSMSRASLARAIGEVGNLAQNEQEAAIALLPTEFSTPEEAKAGFEQVRGILGIAPRK